MYLDVKISLSNKFWARRFLPGRSRPGPLWIVTRSRDFHLKAKLVGTRTTSATWVVKKLVTAFQKACFAPQVKCIHSGRRIFSNNAAPRGPPVQGCQQKVL